MNNLEHSYKFALALGSFVVMSCLISESAFAHPGHGSHVLPNLAEQILTPQLTIVGLTLAFGFGAIHALTPGHGKAIVTSYLVGSNSTFLHALFLSVITTITHTISIFCLGLLVLLTSNYFLPEQLYFVLSLLSGISICIIGFWRLESYFNPVEEHHHHHINNNDPTAKSLFVLGIGSGLIPCSEALVLLLSAIALHREIYGILLVSAFSLGLALVLAVIGLVAVYCRQWLDKMPQFNSIQAYLTLS